MKIIKCARIAASKFTLPPNLEYEDCVQELVTRALEKGIENKPKGYLIRAFRNMILKMLRYSKIREMGNIDNLQIAANGEYDLLEYLLPVEKDAEVLMAVIMNNGVVSSAAEMMGVSPTTMYRKWDTALGHLRAVHGKLMT